MPVRKPELSATVAADRPKALSRSDRAGSVFLRSVNLAIDACGLSSAEVAREWAIAEPIARAIRMGVRPLTAERIDRLPARVRVHVARLMLAEAEGEGAPGSVAGPERQVLVVAKRAGELAGCVHDAVADGVLDHEERRAIARHAGAVIDAATATVRSVRGAK